MTKIAIIGAGGYEFPLQLMNDFLSFPSTSGATYALMDIDPSSLARTERLARRLVETHKLPARIEPTTDRREALRGADFVVVCFQVGGMTRTRWTSRFLAATASTRRSGTRSVLVGCSAACVR